MKIVADRNIPEVENAFQDLGRVELVTGREVRRADLRDCQCLVVRTATRVDAELLDDTPVEFVGTATIGTDHVDLEYLRKSNIAFSNAAGCNAEAAAEYVVSGLFALSRQKGLDPLRMRAGIIGFGNVGSRLYRKLDALGIDCLLCDPPLAAAGLPGHDFVDLDRILRDCNLISLHVPLTMAGAHATFHLIDANRLQRLAPGCLLINAARGEVVDNAALLELLGTRGDLHVFLDTWENEPLVSRQLLRRVDLATPHIAGYSVEGRLRGTQMVLDATCEHFGLSARWHMSQRLPAQKELTVQAANSDLEFWQKLFQAHCDIGRDHAAFVSGAELDDPGLARHFDGLRRVYPDRLEYERCVIQGDTAHLPLTTLRRLGFQIAL